MPIPTINFRAGRGIDGIATRRIGFRQQWNPQLGVNVADQQNNRPSPYLDENQEPYGKPDTQPNPNDGNNQFKPDALDEQSLGQLALKRCLHLLRALCPCF